MHHTMKNNHPKSSAAAAGLKKLFSGSPPLCLLAAVLFANLALPSAQADQGLTILLDGDNALVSWNATASGSANLEHSMNLSSWSTLSANNTEGSFLHAAGNSTGGFYRLQVLGLFAKSPGLASFSDTGSSAIDGVTYDRTPTLRGSVLGAASHVRISINGQLGELVPVENGEWTYTVPAEAPLTAGVHTITVTPVDGSDKAGELSSPLFVTVQATPPASPTLVLGDASDTGAKGDGRTTESEPLFSGTAPLGSQVKVTIDGVVAGQAQADAQTGIWSFQSPRLANGSHEVLAVATGEAGLESAPANFTVVVVGPRTVMLDASSGWTVELTPSHILGGQSQGFIVTKVHGGTLQKWVAADNAWVQIPAEALGTDPTTLENAPAIRTIAYTDIVRWTPAASARGMGAAFDVIPLDRVGGATQPVPAVGTVPGKLVGPRIRSQAGVGTTITWSKPIDGCGCASTRYSIEATREDGQTLLYNLPYSVNALSIVEGGAVMKAKVWGATKTGAGKAHPYHALATERALRWLNYTVTSSASFAGFGIKARAQLDNSPTATKFTTNHPLGGSHAQLAYLEVQALPDATEAAQGLPAETPMIISSDSNKLTPAQIGILKDNPIFASHLFPGTVNGEVQPDQTRVHFQAGETLRFAGNVDASVRAGATIVVESAQILGDGSYGLWLEEARIPVGSDGGFSHDYVVPYGMVSLRKRLEYSTAMAPTLSRSASPATLGASAPAPVSTPIDLSSYFNAFGITTGPWQVANNQGFDRNGNYYNSEYTGGSTKDPVPGTPITYAGISFPIGPIPTSNSQVGGSKGPQNFVQAKGQTITVSVDADKSDYLYLAGAASNGAQLSQPITLNFTDGSTETWYQSFDDWATNGQTGPVPPFSGEVILGTQPERINQQGNLVKTPVHIYAYVRNLRGKQLASFTLPNNENVGILSAVVSQAPVLALDTGFASLVLATTNLTGVDLMALTIANESNIGVGGSPLTFFFADQPVKGSTTSVALSSIASTGGISRDGQSFSGGGFDGDGNAYSWEALGSSKILRGTSVTFKLGLPGQPNFVVANGQTIQVPQGTSYTTLNLAGAAVNGGQENQPLTLTFTDNSTAVWTQSFSDWCNPEDYTNESTIATASYRDNASGDTNQTTNHIYQYSYTIPSGKTLKSITLPTNSDVRLLDIQITPPIYTTKQVTVPMGQQTTIVYVAPDSASQMTFYVQKADGTCVGPDCSTYLTDWTNGSGNNNYFASNISPSLNTQVKSGQHWTMAIQNAGEGYYGYLNSPSGQNLPHPGGVPGGAQFKLMTQAEIATQPPWAVATEEIVGKIAGVAILTVATGGVADAVLGTEVVVNDVVVSGAGDVVADAGADAGADYEGGLNERIAVDPFYLLNDPVDGEWLSEFYELPDNGQSLVDGFDGDVSIIKTEGVQGGTDHLLGIPRYLWDGNWVDVPLD